MLAVPESVPRSVATGPVADALRRFGHDSLRPGQSSIIADILEGKHTLAIMPTGAGKSLCYQLPAQILASGHTPSVTLVISPLIALMKDQVDSLTAKGVSATALTSASSPDQQREILDGIRNAKFTLVYVAPERFRSPRFLEAMESLGSAFGLLAIDEAHCISEWGHDFRPDYRRVGEMIKRLSPKRLAAFTATATPQVREDIALQLGMTSPSVHIHGFDRPNLTYSVVASGGAKDKQQKIVDLVKEERGGITLVYAATRKNAEAYGDACKRARLRMRVYHAGLEDTERERNQDDFMSGDLDVIVATNAFGMGVDKRDIRLVIHADLPRSPEAYYQEAGRGGRDGLASRCVLLFNHGDVRLQEFLIDASYPKTEVLRGLWKLLKDAPYLGKISSAQEELLRAKLPGEPSAAAVGSAIRILEKHGLLRRDGENYIATRPDPANFAPLDVEGLQRRSEVERSKLRTMVAYAYASGCRRQAILSYFGDRDWLDAGKHCGACDLCFARRDGKSLSLDDGLKKDTLALLNLVHKLDGRLGRTRLTSIAMGEADERLEDLEERGCLSHHSKRDILDLFRSLEGAGLLESSKSDYPTVCTSMRARKILRGKEDLGDVVLLLRESSSRKRGGSSGAAKKPTRRRRRA